MVAAGESIDIFSKLDAQFKKISKCSNRNFKYLRFYFMAPVCIPTAVTLPLPGMPSGNLQFFTFRS